MAYASKIKKVLDEKNISVKDRIKVKKNNKTYDGILMPKPTGQPSILVIKLDNGYNIGLKYDKGTKIKKLKKKKKKKTKKSNLTFDKDKPNISLISTGGTIASKVDYETGGVKWLMKSREILESFPDVADFVNFKSIQSPFTKATEDMDHSDWQNIAKACAKELNKKDIQGIVITQGTDFMHYTAAALSFMLRDLNKPVVLTGSQRSSDRPSSDAGMNLLCSSITAKSDIAEVGICMHSSMSDDYCLFNKGTKVRKMHTSRRDAFRPINSLPLAKVYPNGKIEKLTNYKEKNGKKVKAQTDFEENISMVYFYPGMDGSIIDNLISNGCRGIIVQASGLGHTAVEWKKNIKKATKEKIPVFFTPQTLYGRINMDVYSNGRELKNAGAIPLEDMLPETAYVKLGWALKQTDNLKDLKELMLKNVAGEITKRSKEEHFLY